MLLMCFLLGIIVGIVLTLLFSRKIINKVSSIIYKFKFHRVLTNNYYQSKVSVNHPKEEDV